MATMCKRPLKQPNKSLANRRSVFVSAQWLLPRCEFLDTPIACETSIMFLLQTLARCRRMHLCDIGKGSAILTNPAFSPEC